MQGSCKQLSGRDYSDGLNYKQVVAVIPLNLDFVVNSFNVYAIIAFRAISIGLYLQVAPTSFLGQGENPMRAILNHPLGQNPLDRFDNINRG